jgi:hypothetical protein
MQGAVAGTPGTLPTNWTYGQLSTLTTEIVGTGTETGINYVDIRISGTATTTPLIYFEANSTVAATNNQTWATSVFVKIVGGGTTNISVPTTTLRMSDSGGANLGFVAGSMYTLPTSATSLSACRFSSSHTTNNASTAFVMPAFAFNAAGAIDITLRIGLPQLELGAFATSVIPTTTTALTRSADVASVTTLSPWYNASEGTVYLEAATSRGLSGFPTQLSISDGSAANRIGLYTFTSGYYGNIRSGGAAQGDPSVITTPTAGAQYKFALGVETNNAIACLNGTLGVADTSITMPAGVTQMRIGAGETGAAYSNTWIRRITYYPRKLSSAELQSITSP